MTKVDPADFEKFLEEAQSMPERGIMEIFSEWKVDPNVWQKNIGFSPSWCIECYDNRNDLVHIHFLDFGMDGMKNIFEAYSKNKGLKFSEGKREKYFIPEGIYHISSNGKRIMSMHDTLCSTLQKPYICVHTTTDRKAIELLLSMPIWQDECPVIKQRDLESYRKLYSV